ncbi:MAG: hypothetical protein ACRDO0_19485 [Nocardioidaceae bacterium]
MQDRSYLWIYDFDELDEIRLTADLMIAASDSPRHLSQASIDLALGLGAVRPGRGRDPTSTTGARRPPSTPSAGGSGPLRLV